ncbi:DNA internalization-related competence protein ComEC/Rec2 [Desulfurivibrio dismutans]|uniref:DNA internalization-related competence protein ComEC/Rec2 n=1 Tax=Desulfurivibrio dismutans TaxID=1398908 RepID=UPI0023DC6E87|nr:DNA internalization-related competence protein ComEC/Rec2 [Desulfurivibrio alkaliphilus]MDF1614785.1 DNA internalization-related competence protein ComEC/Rec2 [Desulfurivibrio alkaliphilus]
MAPPIAPASPLPGRLVLPVLSLTAGIATAGWLELPPATTIIPPLAVLLWLLVIILRPLLLRLIPASLTWVNFRRWPTWPPALPRSPYLFTLLLLIFFSAGYNLARPQLTLPPTPSHLYNQLTSHQQLKATGQDSHDVVLVGVAQELPRQNGERTRLVLAAEELHRSAGATATHGLVQLTVNGPLEQEIKPGDRLMVRAQIGPVRAFAVPGAFDYRQFLAHRGIHLSGWLANPLQLAQINEPAPESFRHRLTYLPERLRTRASELLNRHLAAEENLPVLRALLIGDRSGIEAATLEAFKAGGAMHLLAISGMHLGLIALLSMAAAEWLLKRSSYLLQTIHVRKAALLLALVPIIGYALITGLQPPALRALIMTLVFMAAVLSDRQWCSLNNLALAAIIILALDPTALFGASFQLSFAATAGIIMLAPALQDRYQATTTAGRQLLFWVITSLLVSTVATLVTAPLAMYHFHRVSLLSPLTTLLATPLIFFWTLPLALVGLFLAAVSESALLTGLAELLLTAASRGLDLTVSLTVWLAELPGSFFYLAPPSTAEFLCWGILLMTLALARRHAAFPVAAAMMALLLVLLPVYHQWQRQQEPNSRVSFIEVGHGKATVVEMPGNRNFLVDGGGPATLSTDVGEQLIAPFLRQRRIKRLEAVVISHPHADHFNGIPFLLQHFRPQVLWINGRPDGSREYRALLALAEELGIEVRIPEESGQVLAGQATNNATQPVIMKNVADFHLQGPTDFNPPLADPVNDQSLIISYRHGEISFLLPGDIGMEQERRLAAEHGDRFRFRVLAASHHGRRSSMAPEFIRITDPDYIIVSDNEQRVDQQRLNSWQQQGYAVMTTGRYGTVICTTDGTKLQCRPSRH